AAEQVPSVLGDVSLGPQHTTPMGASLGIDAGDPIRQQQRRLWHAHLPREAILLLEQRPVDLRDVPRGVDLQLLAIQLDSAGRQPASGRRLNGAEWRSLGSSLS